jgi:flagellar biosynthetic protein FlhB
MAETSFQERTEEPTRKRIEEAQREGRAPRTPELSAAAGLLAGAGLLGGVGGAALARFAKQLLVQDAVWLTNGPVDLVGAASLLRLVGVQALLALAPLALGLFGLAVVVNGVQARGVLSLTPITPKWSHVSPAAGVARIFSLDALFNLLKAVLKFVILGALTYVVLDRAWPQIISLTGSEPAQVLDTLVRTALGLVLVVGLAFAALAVADYQFQVRRHQRTLRMTRHEVIEEARESEGDPRVRNRLRALARALQRRRMLKDVATADVVITNPTEIAVALKYDVNVALAPIVVAMGQRKLAQRIRDLALEAGVPLMENRPLARALLSASRVGEVIPPALYVAVAEVIAFVYRRRGRSGNVLAGRQSGGPA